MSGRLADRGLRQPGTRDDAQGRAKTVLASPAAQWDAQDPRAIVEIGVPHDRRDVIRLECLDEAEILIVPGVAGEHGEPSLQNAFTLDLACNDVF